VPRVKTGEQLGNCPLCERILIKGTSVDAHHLIPRCQGGKGLPPEDIHVVCHRKIHSTIPENELRQYYHTWERLLEHEQLKRFVSWVKKKDPEYVDTHRDTKERSRRRKR